MPTIRIQIQTVPTNTDASIVHRVKVAAAGVYGLSNYQLALTNGFVGTLDDWLGTLLGSDGLDAYHLALTNGFVGTLDDWLVSLTGPEGPTSTVPGPAGPDGSSVRDRGAWTTATAYLSRADDPEGKPALVFNTWNDGSPESGLFWCIASHTSGASTQPGVGGSWATVWARVEQTGPRGFSAYELDVLAGYVGSQAAWLAGLHGTNGARGTPAYAGAWSSVTTYAFGDAVSVAGSSYICILAHTNHSPPNATYWDLIAGKGATGATGGKGATAPLIRAAYH